LAFLFFIFFDFLDFFFFFFFFSSSESDEELSLELLDEELLFDFFFFDFLEGLCFLMTLFSGLGDDDDE